MQKVTDAFKVQRSGQARGSTKAGEPAAAAPAHGMGLTAASSAAAAPSNDEQDEATLRQFDLDLKYGPCSGMTRLERFERAVKLGLEPPGEVRELVLRHGADSMFNRNLWEHPY